MSKSKFILVASNFLIALIFSSCEDILAPDLSKKSVQTLSPINNTTSQSFNQNFWWKEVNGASHYQLQIVNPNFVNSNQLILDTTIAGATF